MHEQKGSYLTKVQNQILPKNYFRYELKVDYQNRTLSIGFYQLIQLPKIYTCTYIKKNSRVNCNYEFIYLPNCKTTFIEHVAHPNPNPKP